MLTCTSLPAPPILVEHAASRPGPSALPSLQSRRDRVAAKFVENEFEKCDRLMEVYFRYEAQVAAEEAR